MDAREKLVELIGSTEYGNGSLVGNNFQKGFIEKIASHLIANGVTVQEWVSVNDRLPQNFVSVLGYMTDAGEFPSVRECYLIDGQHFFFPALGEIHPVDKWKEMPPAVDISADMVKVVRCKDYKHYGKNLENDTYCSSVNGLTDPQEDDFCSYGERKDGDK